MKNKLNNTFYERLFKAFFILFEILLIKTFFWK